jgi:hypothetical protein
MTGAQARLGETVDHFYADNSEEAMVAHAYKRGVEQLDAEVSSSLDQTYRATVLEPVSLVPSAEVRHNLMLLMQIGKMSSHFPEVR